MRHVMKAFMTKDGTSLDRETSNLPRIWVPDHIAIGALHGKRHILDFGNTMYQWILQTHGRRRVLHYLHLSGLEASSRGHDRWGRWELRAKYLQHPMGDCVVVVSQIYHH